MFFPKVRPKAFFGFFRTEANSYDLNTDFWLI